MKRAMKMTSSGVLAENVFNVAQRCASGALFACAWRKGFGYSREPGP
jgi:hypothetical protein